MSNSTSRPEKSDPPGVERTEETRNEQKRIPIENRESIASIDLRIQL